MLPYIPGIFRRIVITLVAYFAIGAALLCLLQTFLFAGGSINGLCIRLLSTIKVVHRDQPPMLLVIAMAMLCLDRIRYHPDQIFFDNPLLL